MGYNVFPGGGVVEVQLLIPKETYSRGRDPQFQILDPCTPQNISVQLNKLANMIHSRYAIT